MPTLTGTGRVAIYAICSFFSIAVVVRWFPSPFLVSFLFTPTHRGQGVIANKKRGQRRPNQSTKRPAGHRGSLLRRPSSSAEPGAGGRFCDRKRTSREPAGFFFVFVPHCVSPNLEMSVVQTEGFEYTERSEASGKLRVHAASPGRRFFSTSTTRSCQGTPKKHSTQNTQFAHVLFLFLLLNVFLQLLVFVLTLRCHSCFCCCAPNRLQGMCQFYESLYLQLVKKK
jgi:hypothetical protein